MQREGGGRRIFFVPFAPVEDGGRLGSVESPGTKRRATGTPVVRGAEMERGMGGGRGAGVEEGAKVRRVDAGTVEGTRGVGGPGGVLGGGGVGGGGNEGGKIWDKEQKRWVRRVKVEK